MMRGWTGTILITMALAGACPARGDNSNAPVRSAGGIDLAAYERVVQENLDLRRAQARLAQDAEELRKANASLLLQIKELEQKRDTLAALLSEVKTPEQTAAELARLRQDRATLMEQVRRLTDALAAPRSPGAAAAAPAPTSDLVRKLETENHDLRAELVQSKQARQADAAARAALVAEGQSLTGAVQRVSRENADLRAEQDRLRLKQQKLRDALVKVAAKASEYHRELDRLRAEARAPKAPPPPAAAPPVAPVAVPPAPVSSPAGLAAPAPASSYESAAHQLIAKGRYRDAEAVYRRVLKENPRDAQAHYNLGVLYEDYLRDASRAADHYRRYLELNPSAPDGDIVRGWLIELEIRAK
jgi:tetratricopeptide (TPR) repeat protein